MKGKVQTSVIENAREGHISRMVRVNGDISAKI